MSLSHHAKAYGSAAFIAAFAAGVLVTLGFKDLYPDLERHYQRKTSSGGRSLRRQSSLFWGGGAVELQDLEAGDDEEKGTDEPALASAEAKLESSLASPGSGIEACIGHTPLIEIRSLSQATGRTILAKAEFLNGGGNSPKDRVALSIIADAENRGLLRPHHGDTIYEGSVGSTGISLAALARARGYRAHICMPEDQGCEKSELLVHLGAIVERVAVAPITSPRHYVNLARRRAADHADLARDGSRGFFADQFESPANWLAHLRSTGPEILAQTAGRLDAFVAGAGTGGTLSGVARFLKLEARLSSLAIILADPQGSGLYHKIKHGVMYSPTEREGSRRRQQVDSIVEGIGINRVTENFEAGHDLVDNAVRVTDDQACRMARWLVQRDGIFVGSSSAVNCVAAVATTMTLPPDSRIVTVLCDSGTRHLSRFWKRIGELGLGDCEATDLFAELGLTSCMGREVST